MRFYDLIMKKRDGGTLTEKEIRFMITEYAEDRIPDYQMSAMLMAIYFRGMDDLETAILTDAMARSGELADLSSIQGIKADKHSTGGVGDKTTLIVAPIVAACGVKVAKMSGRGLGHTGGTVDKLESIPGVATCFSRDQFLEIVNKVGISVIGQSGNLAPADKKLYALRDVTATVESIPLIAASIMSKKLAAGSDCILLDVKTGSGAFMKNIEDAVILAKKMTVIGEHAGKRTAALITNMDVPLGNSIGNTLEVEEAARTLMGQGPEDLTEICLHLAANMLYLAKKGELGACQRMAEEAIRNGSAWNKLADMIGAQGGDREMILHPEKLPKARCSRQIKALESGFIRHINAQICGMASSVLGAGRITKGTVIDYTAGLVLEKKTGDFAEKGDTLCTLYTSREELLESGEEKFLGAVTFGKEKPEKKPLIYARVQADSVEYTDRG